MDQLVGEMPAQLVEADHHDVATDPQHGKRADNADRVQNDRHGFDQRRTKLADTG